VNFLAGIDIGGTKCAVCLGRSNSSGVELIAKSVFPTQASPDETIHSILRSLKGLLERYSPDQIPEVIGISCGGPLDLQRGWVLSPPNLPNWKHVDLFSPIREVFPVPIGLQMMPMPAHWLNGSGGWEGFRNLVFSRLVPVWGLD